jgi:hypothetical protein
MNTSLSTSKQQEEKYNTESDNIFIIKPSESEDDLEFFSICKDLNRKISEIDEDLQNKENKENSFTNLSSESPSANNSILDMGNGIWQGEVLERDDSDDLKDKYEEIKNTNKKKKNKSRFKNLKPRNLQKDFDQILNNKNFRDEVEENAELNFGKNNFVTKNEKFLSVFNLKSDTQELLGQKSKSLPTDTNTNKFLQLPYNHKVI